MKTLVALAVLAAAGARTIGWDDLPPAVQSRLRNSGQTASTFGGYVSSLARTAETRVREGDFDHLVFYVLQSTHFTTLPPIEPALSAKAFAAGGRVPAAASARMAAFLRTIASSDADPRVSYFRAMLRRVPPAERRPLLEREYARGMKFLYEKEFLDPSKGPQLYQTRGLSTDTAVEAGYAVHAGLGVLKGLEPSRRIRRVLIVGPGIDLAPRTGMLEAGPPESYQPWASIDALVSLGLSQLAELQVVAGDINPRVVEHLRSSARRAPVLRLVSGIGESDTVAFVPGYREYFTTLGRTVGAPGAAPRAPSGHLSKAIAVSAAAAATIHAEPLDIVTQRLTGDAFDLVIATNVLPYFGGAELALALSNIAAMLTPGGVFLHNDPRPEVQEDAALAGLAPEQLRQVLIATVKGAPPLADTIVLHKRK
ncbi:MAG TPA: class I SAM-dependent methyltransferase [Vicinamibacterales bacterium]|nr:class I SAM-dependent methyltransferase [Vicinamibacterales bacterium]